MCFKIYISFIALCFSFKCIVSITVCKTELDYYTNENCWENNDEDLNTTQILRNWGFTAEEYEIFTDDGYGLTIIRGYGNITNPTPIILGHAVLINSRGFLFLQNSSLAYKIIESGHQIFLINFRGTEYSQKHVNLTKEDREYWNFSWHESGYYDIPKVLELVSNITYGQKAIIVGYSMGSTTSLVYASRFPDEAAQKLLGIICLGTASLYKNTPSVLRVVALLEPLVLPLGLNLWNGRLPLRQEIGSVFEIGSSDPILYNMMDMIHALFVGWNYNSVAPDKFPIFLSHVYDTTSAKTIQHYGQIVLSERFASYDYGPVLNRKKYGTPKPPEYDFSKIKVKIAQFLGRNDILCTAENGLRLQELLKPEYRCGVTVISDPLWTHLNFINHRDSESLLVTPVLNKIKAYEAGGC
ncbi:lipase member N-like [Diabrotica undecimpunctata]|uniref:lipase member N-like n=1 Tax=Diabrotica undecimpunctata TaxID=50387 RepID=UPI003B6341E6